MHWFGNWFHRELFDWLVQLISQCIGLETESQVPLNAEKTYLIPVSNNTVFLGDLVFVGSYVFCSKKNCII